MIRPIQLNQKSKNVKIMSAIASVLSACPNVQVDLFEAFNRYENRIESLPFLEYLRSPVNTSNITNLVYRGRGKTVDVDVRYFKRFAESELLESQPNPVCSGGSTDPDTTATYTIDTSENVQDLRTFSIHDLERYCADNPFYVADLIMRMVDNVERGIATKSATQAAALIGKWASDVTVDADDNLEIATKNASGEFDVSFLGDVRLALTKTNYVGGAANFADTLLYRAYMDAQQGCCNDNGIDVSASLNAYGIATMWDRRLEAAMTSAQGANTSMVVQPGALALLYHTRSEWTDGMPADWKIGSDYAFRPIIGRTGTPLDLTVSDNCGVVTIAVTGTTKVVGLPTDMFKSGDTFEGVTGVNSIQTVNP